VAAVAGVPGVAVVAAVPGTVVCWVCASAGTLVRAAHRLAINAADSLLMVVSWFVKVVAATVHRAAPHFG
jgi:hypothetical protein